MREVIANENCSINDIMGKLDMSGKRIVLIEDKGILKGVVTDGDIRRWLMKNGDINASIKNIVNYKPIYITENEKQMAKEIMKKNSINSLPVIDVNGEIKSIIFWDDEELEKNNKLELDIPVIIMAGGKGTRLYPYTKILPKPLIPIGDIPIIERIINKFSEIGCNQYYLTVNYKKNMIKSYFDDIDKDYKVEYVEEEKPLGTGGSLYLLKDEIKKTFFLSNCDILVDADYSEIYKQHKEHKNDITMICAVKNLVIPYGVINLNNEGSIEKMVEKPEYSFLTNTGMYLVEPNVIDRIPKNEFMNFPDLIDSVRMNGGKVGVYSISEECWMDMGQIDEMQEMIKKIEEK